MKIKYEIQINVVEDTLKNTLPELLLDVTIFYIFELPIE